MFARTSLLAALICHLFIALSVSRAFEAINREAYPSLIPSEMLGPEEYASEGIRAWYDGDHDQAIALLSRALELDPDMEDTRVSLTLVHRENGDVASALEVAGELTESNRVHYVTSRIFAGQEIPPGEEALQDGWDYFWSGVSSLRQGEYEEARGFLDQAREQMPTVAYTHYFRGRVAVALEDWETAIDAFTTARRREPNITVALLPLAEAHYAIGDVATALNLLERARLALPWDNSIAPRLALWQEEQPLAVREREIAADERQVAYSPPVAEPLTAERDTMRWIRVGLARGLSSIQIRTGGPYYIVAVPDDLVWRNPAERQRARQYDPGQIVLEGTESEVLTVRTNESDSSLQILRRDGTRIAVLDGTFRIAYPDPRHTTVLFDLAYSEGQFSAGREDRAYRGEIEFLSPPEGGSFTVINDVPLEEYLYSVVPSEMPASWPAAALQAQAVAARSYTLHPRRRFLTQGFDLQSSVLSAFYRGVTGEHPRTTAAVEATRGAVLMDGTVPLDAVYSANTAGYTESSESVWGSRTALVSVSDPALPALTPLRSTRAVYDWIQNSPGSYSGAAPFAFPAAYRWSLFVAPEDISRRLENAGTPVGLVERIIPGIRGVSGRVEEVTVIGSEGTTVVRRDVIRSRLGGLRSNLFLVSPVLRKDGTVESFFFQGAGWGHGVGMCQTGAAGMAAEGWDYVRILQHYYPEAELLR